MTGRARKLAPSGRPSIGGDGMGHKLVRRENLAEVKNFRRIPNIILFIYSQKTTAVTLLFISQRKLENGSSQLEVILFGLSEFSHREFDLSFQQDLAHHRGNH